MATLSQVILRDTRANQPAAGTTGRLYYVTDESVLERDSGSAWQSVEGAGGLADHGVVTYFDFTNASAPGTPASGKTRIYTKTDKAFYQKDDAGVESALGGGGGGSTLDYILVEDQKTSGTNGGTFTSGAWQTRDLNTEVADAGNHASVASNQITLAAGTYRCQASAPVYSVGGHMIRLQDITNSATLISGTTGYSPGGADPPVVRATLQGRFTLSGSTVIELQHRCVATKTTTGYGGAAGFTVPHETYSVVEFWKE